MEAPQAGMSVVGRMLRVFYAPSETFEAVAEQRGAADWLVPTIIVAVVVFITMYLTAPIQVAETREMIQKTPLEGEEVVQIARVSGAIGGSVTTFVMLFIIAAFYLLVGKLLGGLLDYGQTLAIAAYTSLISGLQHIVTTPLVLANETMNVQTGLGIFLS